MQGKILIVWCLFYINVCFGSPSPGLDSEHPIDANGLPTTQPLKPALRNEILEKIIALERSAKENDVDLMKSNWNGLFELLGKPDAENAWAKLTRPEDLIAPLRFCKVAADTIEKNELEENIVTKVKTMMSEALRAIKTQINKDMRAIEFVESYHGTFPAVFKGIHLLNTTAPDNIANIEKAVDVVFNEIESKKHSIEDIRLSPNVIMHIERLIAKVASGAPESAPKRTVPKLQELINETREFNEKVAATKTITGALNCLDNLTSDDEPNLLTASTAAKLLREDLQVSSHHNHPGSINPTPTASTLPHMSSDASSSPNVTHPKLDVPKYEPRDLENTAMLIFLLTKLSHPNGKELYKYETNEDIVKHVKTELRKIIERMVWIHDKADDKWSHLELLICELNYYGWYLVWFPHLRGEQQQILTKYNELIRKLTEEPKSKLELKNKFDFVGELEMNEKIHQLHKRFLSSEKQMEDDQPENVMKELVEIQKTIRKRSIDMRAAYEAWTKPAELEHGEHVKTEEEKVQAKSGAQTNRWMKLNIWYLSPLYTRKLAEIEIALLMQNRLSEFVPEYHAFYP